MNRIQHAVLAGLLLLGPARAAVADELPFVAAPEAGMSASKLDRAKSVVQAMLDKGQSAGVVVVVARRGKLVLMDALGKMDIAAGKPMSADSIFRIYSMTKPITTAAAMLLHEEGKFQLDDPVCNYLPQFKGLRVLSGHGDETVEARREVTIRDLMRHTSGLTYGGMLPNTPLDRLYRERKIEDAGNTLADMVEKLAKVPLLYQPGTRFNYSVSTDVLGRLVEVASGKPLDQFFQERIFAPLDMRDTGFYVPEDKLARFAASYGPVTGGLRLVDDPAKSRFRKRPKYLSGGGGLVCTARDYLRFCQMMLNGGQLQGTRLLRPETVRQMTTNQLPAEALPMRLGGLAVPGLGFGLGFSVHMAKADRFEGEYGWSGFASTHFYISPKQELVVVVMQQLVPVSLRLESELKPIIYGAIEN
jgi:CubicO group peptidase (beta-lactamase class C family)